MPVRDRIVCYLRKHKRLYSIARCIQKINSPVIPKLIAGYYDSTARETTVLIEHPGDRAPDTIVYYSSLGIENEYICGFFASLRGELEKLNFADRLGMTPVIRWGKGFSVYYDVGMDSETQNVFEYYFKPVSDISYQDVDLYAHVVRSHPNDSTCFNSRGVGSGRSYAVEATDLEQLGTIYRKYIHLNEKTVAYLKSNLEGVFIQNKKTLGVHVRGTDFNLHIKGHPVPISPQEYLDKVKELFSSGDYDQIFLATDDLSALELFKDAFQDKLCYFTDVLRGDDTVTPQGMTCERPLHRYKLGLEVLRDVYALACCDSLVAGRSQVSFGARYINYALDRKYEELQILDKGLESEYGYGATRMMRHMRHQIIVEQIQRK